MNITEPNVKLRALTAAFVVFLFAAVMVSLGAIGYLALRASTQSTQNGEVISQIKAVSDRLIDCTEPTGECAKESQARTAEAVVGINEGTLRVIVAALACQADGVTEQKELARCTVQRAESAAAR